MAKQLRETASHSMWRCFPCLKTTTSTLLCNAQEPPSVTSVCYYRREVEVLSFHGVSSLIHLERFHDCATLHFIHEGATSATLETRHEVFCIRTLWA